MAEEKRAGLQTGTEHKGLRGKKRKRGQTR